jgi:hypothetical protein
VNAWASQRRTGTVPQVRAAPRPQIPARHLVAAFRPTDLVRVPDKRHVLDRPSVTAARNTDGVAHLLVTVEQDATLPLVPAAAVAAPRLLPLLLHPRSQCRKMELVALRAVLRVLGLRSEIAAHNMVGVVQARIIVVLRAMEDSAPVIR